MSGAEGVVGGVVISMNHYTIQRGDWCGRSHSFIC